MELIVCLFFGNSKNVIVARFDEQVQRQGDNILLFRSTVESERYQTGLERLLSSSLAINSQVQIYSESYFPQYFRDDVYLIAFVVYSAFIG